MQEFKDKLATDLFEMTLEDAQRGGICISCNEPARPKCYSQAGLREYEISGLCEKCFDNLFKEEGGDI